MGRILRSIFLLIITCVAVNGSPKFGERIQKENSSLIDIVFRPNHSNYSQNRKNESINQLNVPIIKRNGLKENEKNQPNGQTLSKVDKKKENNGLNSSQTFSERNIISEEVLTDVTQTEPKILKKGIESKIDFNPEIGSFEINFPDIPELAGSEQIRGAPIPPPPPKPPKQVMPDFPSFYPHYAHNQYNYDESDGRQISESAPQQTQHSLLADFSMNIPKGFPHPKKDRRADFKKQEIGARNVEGKPWGTKRSYTYRDPNHPNNFMEMSEVTMTINRQMNPQEAQSQIQSFLEAAQNGQYGPVSSISTGQSPNQRHNADSYDSGESHLIASEPMEPIEPKFPNF